MSDKQYEVLTDFEMEEIAPNEWCLKKFIGFDPQSRNIEIPNEIDGKEIVSLGESLFEGNKQIKNVKIAFGIKRIGNKAFKDCDKLVNVLIPNSLIEIGAEAFYRTDLRAFQLPSSVMSIGEQVCCGCHNLKTVSFSKQLNIIPQGAFEGCPNLSTITFPDSITEIHHKAFSCDIFSKPTISLLNLPPRLIIIGDYAFEGMQIKNLFIPKSVENIGEGAFYACQNLKEIVIEDGCKTKILKNAFGKLVCWEPWRGDYYRHETYLRYKENFICEEEAIGQICCFVPSTVTDIEECFPLIDIFTDPHHKHKVVETTYTNLMIYCEKGSAAMDWARKRSIKCADYKSNLPQESKPITTETENPENVTIDMPTVSDESTPPVIETSEIADINDTKEQNSTSTVEAVSEVADENNNATLEADNAVEGNSVDIEEAVEEESDICEEATPVDPLAIFDYEDTDEGIVIKSCKDTALQKVVVPDGVVEIGTKAFYAMENLEEVVLPEGLIYIGADAFHNCKKLSAITLPQSLTKIGRSAFLGCRCSNEYKQFVIPENVVEIAPFALPQSLLAFKNKENWVRLDAISRKEKMMGKIPSDKLKFADKARDLYQKFNQDIWKRNK